MRRAMVPSSSFNVLVVGAGGIGCELLKNLVLENFERITVIDLDTIDISNLNRQFLFQKVHVGRSKAEVARESVRRFRPDCDITAIHKSILSSAFNVEFFSGFDLVFNALDNRAARRHVNRLCVAAKRPLIESGTAGYLGQVEPLLPTGLQNDTMCNGTVATSTFRTGCYECQPRGTAQKTYPACTIRNTPSEPIHCVVWAKYLFNQLFGEPDIDGEDVSPDMNDPELRRNQDSGDDASNQGQDQHESNKSVSLRSWFQGLSNQDGMKDNYLPVCDLAWRLFHQDIVTLLGMRDLWVDRQDRREPTPLDQDTFGKVTADCSESSTPSPCPVDSECDKPSALRDQRCLSESGWLQTFLRSAMALLARTEAMAVALTWDKDDEDAMDFVAGAAILRAQLFHLPGAHQLTRFSVKSLAGNIIPAIATTNAIVAGLMVLQARQVLARAEENIRTVYVQRKAIGRLGNQRFVSPCDPAPPNPSCYVCSAEATKPPVNLVCHPNRLTLRILRDQILIRHLGMLAPDVELEDRGIILISSEEGETDEDTLNKTLYDFAVTDGVRLLCDDFRQDFQIRLVIITESSTGGDSTTSEATDDAGGWRIVGDVDASSLSAKTNEVEKSGADTGKAEADGAQDQITILSDDEAPIDSSNERLPVTASKRHLRDVEEAPAVSKKARMESALSGDEQQLDDNDEDLICLD